MVPSDYRYTKEHEWIHLEGNDVATVGITDYAQHALGDVVFVELPKPGAKLEAGKSLGTVESVKAVSEIYAPASGEVAEINEALGKEPELLNQDPHGKGWLIRLKLSSSGEVLKLMDASAYQAYISDKDKEASGASSTSGQD